MSLFLNAHHDLRSGWKFAAYVSVFVIILLAAAILLSMVLANTVLTGLTLLAVNAAALFLPAVLAMLFMIRFVDHVPLVTFGLGFYDGWRRDLVLGIALAALLLVVLFIGAAVFGELDVRWTGNETSAGSLAFTIAVLLVSAANEELVFRGYPLQTLMRGIGPWPAMILMSCLFGLLHADNPNSSILAIVNTILAGLMLSLAYLKTRSLWFPYGLHVGWNVGLGCILGFPLSGLDIASLWTTEVRGADALLGGQYGPEGGALATAIFLAGAATVQTLRAVGVSPQVRAALAANSEKVYTSNKLTSSGDSLS